ncbi:MAG: prepilin-type N-terminal cleavage/methylation domain-containing protein [Phycisphaerae bacterium]|nr:prepilin-type N-terminal cleavage/methylation domain-containing protein [Phycisphaerae bacterium]
MRNKSVTRRQNKKAGRSGFSLIEAIIAITILGVALTAVVGVFKSGTQMNAEGSHRTRAVYLAQEIQEWTASLPFTDPQGAGSGSGSEEGSAQTYVDDLDDLYLSDGLTYSPPVATPDASSPTTPNELTDLAGWSQIITMSWRSASDPGTSVAVGSSNVVLVTVTIQHQGDEILSTSWLITNNE